MKFVDLLTSRYISGLALFLSRVIPERFGYRIADQIARAIVSFRNSAPARAVRANQWIVSRKKMTAAELDYITQRIFRFTGYALYDYYHNLTRPEVVRSKVEFTPRLRCYMERCQEGREGTMIVIPHLGNFDMAGMALALHGFTFQVLSYPQPPGGYRLQNKIRKLTGVFTTPMTMSAMREATDRLRKGGTVMTGLDRPLKDGNYRPLFFDYPAGLPVAYVGMAMKAQVPVVVASVEKQENGKYLVDASEPIEMKSYPDHHTEILQNAETVLKCAEEFIRRIPQQWVMYYPVWPEALAEMP